TVQSAKFVTGFTSVAGFAGHGPAKSRMFASDRNVRHSPHVLSEGEVSTEDTQFQDSTVIAGGWFIRVFRSSSPAQNVGAALSAADSRLVLFDKTTPALNHSITIPGPGIPYRIALDQPDGKVVVAIADTSLGITRFLSIDALTGV